MYECEDMYDDCDYDLLEDYIIYEEVTGNNTGCLGILILLTLIPQVL
jgi:hypothetical protein